MLNALSNPNLLISGLLLALLQGVAALPWLWAVDPRAFARAVRTPASVGTAVLAVVGGGLLAAGYLGYQGAGDTLQLGGKVYGSVLHLQLLIDFFILAPLLLVVIAPKTGAVALAAYREGWRQPMFWLIAGLAALVMLVAVVVPYFTFGDDYKMMKQIGFDIAMLAAVLFGVLAASTSIAEEIEGRTAITVMSKPIDRRSFLFGKFLGILLAAGGMTLVLGWVLNWTLIMTPEFDKINLATDPMREQASQTILPYVTPAFPGASSAAFAGGMGHWIADTVANGIGLLLGFGQVMILVAVASALATRLPFVVNVVVCLVVYFLGHLAPVLVKVSDQLEQGGEGSAVGAGLVRFLGQLFDTLLPSLEYYTMSPAIVRETPLDLWAFAGHVVSVFGYSVLYTGIVLIVGLLLFEDRDLA